MVIRTLKGALAGFMVGFIIVLIAGLGILISEPGVSLREVLGTSIFFGSCGMAIGAFATWLAEV